MIGKCDDEILKIIEMARNYNCMTHTYENKNKNYKSICVVDPFIRIWKVDNNHQKYDKIAIVWNVGISEMMKIFLERKQMRKCQKWQTNSFT